MKAGKLYIIMAGRYSNYTVDPILHINIKYEISKIK